VPHIKVSCD